MTILRVTQRTILIGLIAVGAVVAIAGCKGKNGDAAKAAAQPPVTVEVSAVRTGSISASIPVVGNLETLYTVNLSPQTAGRLINVFVREGDTVHIGQILAQIDPTQAAASVRQDQANVLSAVAKVDQAQATYQQAVVAAQVGIRNAKSALASAKATYQKTVVGDQPQEKAQVNDQYAQQQANYENALAAYNREQVLYNAGAVALSDLQNAQTTYSVQKALLDSYAQSVSLAKQGGRPEDIEAARQTVVQQQQNLQNAYANQQNVNVDKQAIVAAQAAVAQARAVLVSAEQDLANTNLVSTINGVVAARNQDPGSIAQPGTAVLQIVDLSTVYYEPTVSEDQFRQIAPGQEVAVNVDALPGDDFNGTVTQIFPSANTSNRQFSIRVSIPNSGHLLRPGMYARGSITTETHRNVIIVPVSAMLPQSSGSGYQVNNSSNGIATGVASVPPQMVYLFGADGKAHQTNVVIGIDNGSDAEITSGLKVGDQLIVKGQGEVQDGDTVQLAGKGGHHHSGGGAGAGGGSAAGQPGAS